MGGLPIEDANIEFKKIHKHLTKQKRLFIEADILFFEQDFEKAFSVLNKIDVKGNEYYMDLSFNKLLCEEFKEAKEIARTYLVKRKLDISLQALIINYELAKKRLGEKVKKDRINSILSSTVDSPILIACYLLNDDYSSADEEIRKKLKKTKVFVMKFYVDLFFMYIDRSNCLIIQNKNMRFIF